MHKHLELDMVRVVEQAAIAAARFMGTGDRTAADHAAVEAMREQLAQMNMRGRIVIGEGERDEAPMLYIGEQVGAHKEDMPEMDIAVDPLEGTNLVAQGVNNAITVMAIAEKGGLLHAPDMYMNKLVVSPEAADKVDILAPVHENLQALATALNRTVAELVVVVLERDRHEHLIAEIRAAGARIKLIPDGDILPAITATIHGTNVHALMGIGAAPEGVLAAAALKCLNGYMQAQFVLPDDANYQRLIDIGIKNPEKVMTIDDLAPGEDLLFVASGVTDGDMLKGVQFLPGGARTHSLFMSLHEGTIRFIDTIHSLDRTRLHVIFQ
jgi:fructose-1,6-bisphosphatase II